ncbi:MAG: pyridoxal phosphate-dependent aminotransferase [Blastocatellia bacterium]
MFSSRFQWGLETNRLSRLIERKRSEGARILDLTESNPTRAGFAWPEGLLDALTAAEALRYDPAPRGLAAARRAVCGYYRERGFAVDPERLHLTASTSEAYSFLFKLLADHGDSMLVPRPSYPLFDFLAAMEGIAPRTYDLDYIHGRGWRIDFDSIRSALTPRTRAVIVVSPNNPTGSFLGKDEAGRLNDLCREHGLALIVDEVFGDYGFAEDAARAASLVENEAALTFVMSGFSKVLALPQMKLGWIATNGPAGMREEALERLDFVADTFLSVGAPVQHAALQWLPLRAEVQSRILDRARENLRRLAALVRQSPCRLLDVEGGWCATIEIPRLLPEEECVLMLLEEENVLTHPGYFFDFPREAHLVLSLLPESALFQEAVERILRRLQ